MSNPQPESPARGVWSRASLAGLAAIWLVIVAGQVLSLKQAIDGDEGFYLAAGRLVSEGRRPYLDFFYPQAPLLPYYLAPFLKLFGNDFLVGRIALLLVTAWLPLFLILIFRELSREKSGLLPALAGLLFFAVHPWTFYYLLIIKGWGIPMTAWLAALWLFFRALSSSGRARLVMTFASGFCFSVAVNVRAPFLFLGLPFVVGLAWAGVREDGWRGAVRILLVFGLGTILPGLPPLIALLRDPQVFWFNNYGYHSLRYRPLAFFNPQKNLRLRIFAEQPLHLFGISCTLLVMVMSYRRRKERTGSLMLSGLGLSGLMLLGMAYAPNPIFGEYFVVLIPFFSLMIFLGFETFPSPWFRRVLTAGLVLAALLQLPAWLFQLQSQNGLRINSHSRLARWRDDEAINKFEQWSYQNVQMVVETVNQWSKPGEEVLAFWPGFVAASHAAFVPGFENQFAMRVISKLSPEEMAHYHLPDSVDIANRIESGEFRIIVFGQWNKDFYRNLNSAQQVELEQRMPVNYRRVFQDHQVSLLIGGQAPVGEPFDIETLIWESFTWSKTFSIQEQTIPGLYGDRLTVYGYLIQPHQLSQPCPAVILLHGGFHSDSMEWLLPGGGLALSLSQAGYVVLALDQRGSSKRDQAFADLADLGTSEVNDVLSAFRFLQTRPGVDPRRVALMGTSRGAALALRAAEKTNEFRLVVGYSSVVDYRLLYCGHGCAQSAEGKSWCENLWRSEQEEPAAARSPTDFCEYLDSIARCQPWEAGCWIFEDGSPLLHLDRLHTPVLLHHGQADTAAPFQDVLVLERGLEKYQVPHRLFVYSNYDFGPLGHSFLYPSSPFYNEPAAEVAWDRTLRALDYYLKDKGFWAW